MYISFKVYFIKMAIKYPICKTIHSHTVLSAYIYIYAHRYRILLSFIRNAKIANCGQGKVFFIIEFDYGTVSLKEKKNTKKCMKRHSF